MALVVGWSDGQVVGEAAGEFRATFSIAVSVCTVFCARSLASINTHTHTGVKMLAT